MYEFDIAVTITFPCGETHTGEFLEIRDLFKKHLYAKKCPVCEALKDEIRKKRRKNKKLLKEKEENGNV